MKNFLLAVVAVFMLACPAIAQDRADILAQVAAIKDLSLCNTEAIAKVDTRVGTLERAVFGYTETYAVQEPVTEMREVIKTRTIPPLLFNAVPAVVASESIQMTYPAVTNVVDRSVTRTRNVYGSTSVLSNNAVRTKSKTTTSTRDRRGPVRRFFSQGQARNAAACPS